jgi:hypothetical protein
MQPEKEFIMQPHVDLLVHPQGTTRDGHTLARFTTPDGARVELVEKWVSPTVHEGRWLAEAGRGQAAERHQPPPAHTRFAGH